MKKLNEFAGASQAYEAPEIETIEVRMETGIASTVVPCSTDIEHDCPDDCGVD